ncbi:hypothetical protein EGH51_24050 [Klebsiella aerogenes]|nr:hypothetical protein OA41_17215 [Klebsiella aerogenes]RSV97752.1 hypothetical protein EGH51_24050 [Klebsiella aerogenes]RSW73643.1 hypothetical protein EGH62_24715 [Klebsiella aerogenes]
MIINETLSKIIFITELWPAFFILFIGVTTTFYCLGMKKSTIYSMVITILILLYGYGYIMNY